MQQASIAPTTRHAPLARWLYKRLTLELFLGLASIALIASIWQFARPLDIPLLKNIPPLSEVFSTSKHLLASKLYWQGWELSIGRVTAGFLIAQLVGIPIGLWMAMHRASFETMFPIVEILRPVPPVAWIPISIIFWPTRELSVIFIVFLGAFWIVVLNTVGGASNIDPNYRRAAL